MYVYMADIMGKANGPFFRKGDGTGCFPLRKTASVKVPLSNPSIIDSFHMGKANGPFFRKGDGTGCFPLRKTASVKVPVSNPSIQGRFPLRKAAVYVCLYG